MNTYQVQVLNVATGQITLWRCTAAHYTHAIEGCERELAHGHEVVGVFFAPTTPAKALTAQPKTKLRK